MDLGFGFGFRRGKSWWKSSTFLMGGISPSVNVDFGRDRYALANVGPNLVVNGDFSAGLTGWTADAGVSVSGNTAVFVGSTTDVSLYVRLPTINPGDLVSITYTVSSYSAGQVRASLELNRGVHRTAAGSYNEVFVSAWSNPRLFFQAVANTGGSFAITNIIVRKIAADLGPELIQNGTFNASLAGWTDASTAPASVSWSSANGGQALTFTDSVAAARLWQAVSTIAGRTYVLTHTGTNTVRAGTTNGGSDLLGLSAGATRLFVATSATTYINSTTVVNGATLDNVSVREVLTREITNQPVQPVTFEELFSLSSGPKTVIANDNSLKTVAANTPAFDYSTGQRRLLLEGAATNIVTYSDDITATTSWTSDGATKSLVSGASRLSCPAGSHYPRFNFTQVANTTYSLQFEARIVSGAYASLSIGVET